MSVTVIEGNLFDLKCDAYVNAVNCVGVMGKGIALEFKNRYPAMFREYKAQCGLGLVKVGEVSAHIVGELDAKPRIVFNFPTKTSWKLPSQMMYVTEGLASLEQMCFQYGVKTLAMPALGCGLGGLEFDKVLDRISRFFEDSDVRVFVMKPR